MTDNELKIFSSWKQLAILREFNGSFRGPEKVYERLLHTGKKISKGLINVTLELALECDYVIHERKGKRFVYQTTKIFRDKYKQVFTSPVEELDSILNS
jgi:hypothetical protein